MIEVQHVSKHFGTLKAVDKVSFSIQKGETLVLVGTSGSGKTTTLKMLNRLIEPSSGTILMGGKNILQHPPSQIRREMGYVIQHFGLFPHYTIAQNVAIVPKLLKWEPGRIQERSHYLLHRLGIPPEEYADKYPHQLSGGQQQRVGIARALAADPPIILMDEPFGALDPITRNSIRQDFMELEELSSKTTVMVTHDVEEAFELGDWICVMDKGRVQQLGTPKDLLFRPANEFVRQFLADKLLQLEFRVLRLHDLLPHIPDQPARGAQPVALSPKTTIFEALSQLMKRPADRAIGESQWQGTSKTFDLQALTQHFHQTLETLKR